MPSALVYFANNTYLCTDKGMITMKEEKNKQSPFYLYSAKEIKVMCMHILWTN